MSVALAVLITLALTILALNLSTGEKKIKRRITPLYGTSDPQFRRSMGHLLGPPLVSGNRTTTLVNGDRIFPAMLEAIAGAKETICFESRVTLEEWKRRAVSERILEYAAAIRRPLL